jgi:hypothetical protein
MADVMYVNYSPEWRDWLLSIMGRLQQSPDPQLRAHFETWSKNGLGDLGCALVTKMMSLGAAIRLFNDQMKRVDEELRAESDDALRELIAAGAVYTFRDKILPYDVLVAVDSFVFEAQSAYGLLQKFVKRFFRKVLREPIADLDHVLTTLHAETEWVETLKSHRNDLIHNTAPWIAFEVSWVPTRRFHLLLEKRIASQDPADLIPYKDLQRIYLGLRLALPCLNRFIIDRITAFEQKHLRALSRS